MKTKLTDLKNYKGIDYSNEISLFEYGLLSYTDMNENNWLNLEPVNQISDLLSYFGYINIFGSSYNSFEIENN